MAQKYIEDDFVMTRTEPNNFTPNGVVCKFVDYETIDKVLLRTINGIDEFIVEKGQFVPIPLPPSILEKNGWEHKDDIYFKEFPHRKLVIMDENAYIINECCSMFLCPAKFVPQLQHLLFGLGLNHKMEVWVWMQCFKFVNIASMQNQLKQIYFIARFGNGRYVSMKVVTEILKTILNKFITPSDINK